MKTSQEILNSLPKNLKTSEITEVLKNHDYDLNRNLHKDIARTISKLAKIMARTNHQFFTEVLGLEEGQREVEFSSSHPYDMLKEMNSYLDNTSVHEYSGALYDDLTKLSSKIKRESKKFLSKYKVEDIILGRNEKYYFKNKREVSLSNTEVIFALGIYHLVSSDSILYSSKKIFRKNISSQGSAQYATLGHLEYV